MKIFSVNSIKNTSPKSNNSSSVAQNTIATQIDQTRSVQTLGHTNMSYLVGFKGIYTEKSVNFKPLMPQNIFLEKIAGNPRILVKDDNNKCIMNMIIEGDRYHGTCNNKPFDIKVDRKFISNDFKGYSGILDGKAFKVKLGGLAAGGLVGKLGGEIVDIWSEPIRSCTDVFSTHCLIGKYVECDQIDIGNRYIEMAIEDKPSGKEVQGYIYSKYNDNYRYAINYDGIPDGDKFAFISSDDNITGRVNSKSPLLPLLFILDNRNISLYYRNEQKYNDEIERLRRDSDELKAANADKVLIDKYIDDDEVDYDAFLAAIHAKEEARSKKT